MLIPTSHSPASITAGYLELYDADFFLISSRKSLTNSIKYFFVVTFSLKKIIFNLGINMIATVFRNLFPQ